MTRYLGDDWLIPALDATNESWFTAGKITAQSCNDCGTFQHPPDEICGSCQGTNLSFKDCSGEGTVESVAVVEREQLREHVAESALPHALGDEPTDDLIHRDDLTVAPVGPAGNVRLAAVVEPRHGQREGGAGFARVPAHRQQRLDRLGVDGLGVALREVRAGQDDHRRASERNPLQVFDP